MTNKKQTTCKAVSHYETDADASEISMRRTSNFVVKQTQRQAVHTWHRSKRRQHAQKCIQREKQTVSWNKRQKWYYKENYGWRRNSDDIGIFFNSKKKKTKK